MTTPVDELYVDVYAALFALRRDEPARYDNDFITGQLERATNGPSPERYAANLRVFDPTASQPPLEPENDDDDMTMVNDDLRGYSTQQAAQDFLDAEVGIPGKHTVVPDPDGTWRIQLGKPQRPPRPAGPATVPFKPKLQGSVRNVIDAAMHIGDSESERITGPGGLSGATPEQLNQILLLAKQRGWKGQPARFSQDQQPPDPTPSSQTPFGKGKGEPLFAEPRPPAPQQPSPAPDPATTPFETVKWNVLQQQGKNGPWWEVRHPDRPTIVIGAGSSRNFAVENAKRLWGQNYPFFGPRKQADTKPPA